MDEVGARISRVASGLGRLANFDRTSTAAATGISWACPVTGLLNRSGFCGLRTMCFALTSNSTLRLMRLRSGCRTRSDTPVSSRIGRKLSAPDAGRGHAIEEDAWNPEISGMRVSRLGSH